MMGILLCSDLTDPVGIILERTRVIVMIVLVIALLFQEVM
jgi:hypothetical protein